MGIKNRAAATLAALVGISGLVAAAVPSAAGAGEYVVAQCDAHHQGFGEARFDRTSGAYYSIARGCSGAGARALRIANIAAAPVAAEGRISFSAPAGVGITGVRVDADLRSDGGHRARLAFLDSAGRQAGRVGTGTDEPGGFERYSHRLEGAGRPGFAALLICAEQRPCPESAQARSAIRNIRLTLRDRVPPVVTPSGSLFAIGWVKGTRRLAYTARDTGAGLRSIEVSAGGRPLAPSRGIGCAAISGTQLVSSARPCPRTAAGAALLDTRRAPFRNGANTVRVCARDYGKGGNLACSSRTVAVDNLAPTGAFQEPSRRDPELITARLADRHSGVASATIWMRPVDGGPWRALPSRRTAGGVAARVDSSSVPAGRWAFRVIAADRAGNARAIDRTQGGRPMVLELPLLERTSLEARIRAQGHRVRYGRRPLITGRLRTESRAAPAGLPLTLVERFEPGSTPRRRLQVIETGRDGLFRARLSAGPSRTVVVRFAGTRRLLPSASRERKLTVAGKVTMNLSRKRVRAGGRVRFRGRLGVAGARVPAPGKVVELQVREQGKRRFRTVGDALHARRGGRVRTSYRFGRFYGSPTRFDFRLKVTRESGWPYRAPTHSRPKRLVVRPRD